MRGYHFHTKGLLGLCLLVLGLSMFATAVYAGPNVTICHYPPGNPAKAKEMTVSASAVPDHLAHGDFQGPCAQDCRRYPAVCNDNSACTTATCNATTGTCGHAPVSCDDTDACTSDSCDNITGCQHDAVSCDDGSQCSFDSCNPATGCTHGTVSCDDNNPCTSDSCTATEGCQHAPVICDDGSQCTIDACDRTTGACTHGAVSCDDHNVCTSDSCTVAEGCQHEPVSCDDGNQCTTDTTCNPATGCTHGTVSCDDNNRCTVDTCTNAEGCSSVPVVCGAGQTCNPATGDCITLSYTLVQTYTNRCIPFNYLELELGLSFPSYEEAYRFCALLCENDSACVQIWVAYEPGTPRTGPYACLTGGGPDFKTWNSSEIQCAYPPIATNAEWYNRNP